MPATTTQDDRLPIACALPEPGLAARSAELKAGLFATVEETRELPDGIAYRFASSNEVTNSLVTFINDERSCCPFLHFELAFEPVHGPIRLRITGPEEAQEFIRETFGA